MLELTGILPSDIEGGRAGHIAVLDMDRLEIDGVADRRSHRGYQCRRDGDERSLGRLATLNQAPGVEQHFRALGDAHPHTEIRGPSRFGGGHYLVLPCLSALQLHLQDVGIVRFDGLRVAACSRFPVTV